MALSTNEQRTHPAGKLGFALSLISAGVLGSLFLYLIVLVLLEHNSGGDTSIFIERSTHVTAGFLIGYGSAFVIGVVAAWKCVIGWKQAPRGWGDRGSYYPFIFPVIGLLISSSVVIYVAYSSANTLLNARRIAYQLPWLQTSSTLNDLRIRASIDETSTSFFGHRELLSDGTMIEGGLRNHSLLAEAGEALVDGKTDAWGNPILYRRLDDQRFMFISFGPDGTADTEDDLASSNYNSLDTSFNFPWINDQ